MKGRKDATVEDTGFDLVEQSFGSVVIAMHVPGHEDLDRPIATHCFLPVNNTVLGLGPARMHCTCVKKLCSHRVIFSKTTSIFVWLHGTDIIVIFLLRQSSTQGVQCQYREGPSL